jgi:hypothetical protein
MTESQFQQENVEVQDKIRNKFFRRFRSIYILGILFILWIIIVIAGVYIWNKGYNWAGINLEIWILIVSIIFVILIILELLLYSRFQKEKIQMTFMSKPESEYINNKKVHIFTYPQGAEGGIFSKTYIDIDEHNILRLRTVIIPPGELWIKKTD